MTRTRPAYMLVELLAVLFMFAAGSGLIISGILAIRQAQQRMVEAANRTALTDDLIRCLSRDIRCASTARLRDGDAGVAGQVLELDRPPDGVTYRFLQDHVERAASANGHVAPKRWEPLTATASVTGEGTTQGSVVVASTVLWGKIKKGDPRPNRRFDFSVRCARERPRATDQDRVSEVPRP